MKLVGGARSLARAAALCLTSGLLVVVGVGSSDVPASAAIACRETFTGTASNIQAKPKEDPWAGASNIKVPVDRTVASVRVTMDVLHDQASTLQFFIYPPGAQGFQPNSQLLMATSGPLDGYYSFDDTATVSIDGSNKLAGTYKPSTPLAKVANRSSLGDWVVWLNNYGGPAGKVRAVFMTLTYADCPDANGDGLHDDADGDGVLWPPDNCPDVANPDQLDSDADGLGDVCDPTPLLPPPPPVNAPGPRDVSLKYAAKKHRFTGAISSDVASCEKAVAVQLYRKKKGADRRLATVRTSDAGRFRSGKVRKPGRYYVRVASAVVDLGAVECAAEKSRTVRVRR
ncbi:thrombospondin type 3 repeat-containing protein [Nocardioides currus]|uniref:P/Homo B domain-containing protein n=1 Tax=Nocardioides currus TaxID=2133958 RepID=A0A2R7Z1H9_9ACTN|nr:thrombospondin type 3 repeat-containing protein [Nocardioides currus]PUA82483.1 hypothetical protein C7S10_01675 [Nocardioides currus]